MEFKWGDAIMVLGLMVEGERYDVQGQFYGPVNAGRYKGRFRIKALGVDNFYIEPERIVDAEWYFRAYNGDLGLPAPATGRLFFRDYIESEGSRGNLLEQIEARGDKEDEKEEQKTEI